MWKRILLAFGAVVACLLALVTVRAALFQPRRAAVEPAEAPVVDAQSAALHLSQMLRFPTISHEGSAEFDSGAFSLLHAYLREAYPRAHAELTVETVGAASLLYTWKGEDPGLPPVVLMAHQDVVPIEPGTEGEWSHPPFSGEIDGGFLWGRGAMDDKGSLIAILEAVETRVSGDDLRRAHGTDERVAVDVLAQMVAFYLQLLERV